MENTNLFKNIQILMDKDDITLYRLSQDTGIAYSTLSNCKHHGTMLHPRHLNTIADYFNVSVDYLLSNGDNDERDLEKHKQQKFGKQIVEDPVLKRLVLLALESSEEDIELAYKVLKALHDKGKK
jgi:transcriptional regulator with XRE-family HTH domain